MRLFPAGASLLPHLDVGLQAHEHLLEVRSHPCPVRSVPAGESVLLAVPLGRPRNVPLWLRSARCLLVLAIVELHGHWLVQAVHFGVLEIVIPPQNIFHGHRQLSIPQHLERRLDGSLRRWHRGHTHPRPTTTEP